MLCKKNSSVFVIFLFTVLFCAIMPLNSYCNPLDGIVSAGSAEILENAKVLEVNQKSERAVIDWRSFDIAPDEITKFNQPSSSSIILNRINSDSASIIQGKISANGNVVLINQNGLVFTKTSQIDVNGIIASTANIKNDDFMNNNGKLTFNEPGNKDAKIINHGVINAKEAGLSGLVSPGAEQNGIIAVNEDVISLDSGDQLTFDMYGDKLIEVGISEEKKAELIENNSLVEMGGGEVYITAEAGREIVDSLITVKDEIKTLAVEEQNGEIYLFGEGKNKQKQPVKDSSYVVLIAGNIENKGKITATKGKVVLAAASEVSVNFDENKPVVVIEQDSHENTIDHTGIITADAGEINIFASSLINIDGVVQAQTMNDKAGEIIIKASMIDGLVNLQNNGVIDVSAPESGDGGNIDTSANKVKIEDGFSYRAKSANGKAGHWLIDPADYYVAASGGDQTGSALGTSLNSGNITITATSANIYINDPVSFSGNYTLTLNAPNNIYINNSITGSGTSSALALYYGQVSAAGTGYSYYINAPVTLPAGSNYSTRQGTSGTLHSYTVITSLGTSASSNDGTLQGIYGNLSGKYALGADIDASSTSSWNSGAGFRPIGNTSTYYTSSFDGLGHVISNLYIDSANSNVGLFGAASSSATLSNVGIENASITASTSNGYIGSLMGIGAATITNCHSSGSVTGLGNSTFQIGGLVGVFSGTMTRSYSTSSVSSTNSNANPKQGGLVGSSSGPISNCYATGNVTSNSSNGTLMGGLVGLNSNTVNNSFSTGNVSNTSASASNPQIGAFVGRHTSAAVVSNSYSTGNVALTGGSGLLGGFIGYGPGAVSYSYSTGTVTNAGSNQAGFINNCGTCTNNFWDQTTSGISTGGVASQYTARTTAQMQTSSTFTGASWDSGGTIWTYNASSYPYLSSFIKPITITANSTSKNYDGNAYTGANAISNGVNYAITYSPSASAVTGSSSVPANLAGTLAYGGSAVGAITPGTYSITPSGYTSNQFYAPTYASGTLAINQKALTVTGTTAPSKTYDGTNSATVAGGSLVGVIGSDTVSLTESGTFNSVNAGSGISITMADSISGAQSSYYTLTQPTVTGTINTAPLTLTNITANNKVYNQTNAATINLASAAVGGAVNGETITISSASGIFGSINVGTGISVTPTYTMSSSNYHVSSSPALTANITVAPLTVTGSAVTSKTYDQTNSATITGGVLQGIYSGDTVTLTEGGTFSSVNVGTGISMTMADSLGGAQAANYSLTQPTVTGTITAKELTVTGTSTPSKTYDQTNSATITGGSLVGVIGGDTVTLTQGGTYSSVNVGTGISMSMSDSISGAQAANYSLTQPTVTGTITAKALTVTGTSSPSKVYTGTSAATITGGSLVGVVGGDTVTLTQGGTYSSVNVGTGIAMNMTNSISGSSSANYSLTQPTVTGTITAKALTVTGTTSPSKTYDQTNAATITGGSLVGVVGGDNVTLTQGGTYSSVNVGTGIPITMANSLGGSEAGNYSLTQPTVTGTITAKALTVTGSSVTTRAYNGNNTATITGGSLVGVVGGDNVTLTESGTFTSIYPGVGIIMTISDSISGAQSPNYSLTQPVVTGTITTATLTVTGSTASKTYDTTTAITQGNISLGTVNNIVGSDAVTVDIPASPAFTTASSNVATYSVTGSGFTLSGAQSAYYSLTQPTISVTISKANLTAPGVSIVNKSYDATTSLTVNATVSPFNGVIGADVVTLDITNASSTTFFPSANAATYNNISVNGLTLGGAQGGNYNLVTPSVTATISKAVLTVSGLGVANKIYDGTTTASITQSGLTLNNIQNSENITLNLSGAVIAFPSKNVDASPYNMTFSGLSLGGTGNTNNYTLTQPSASATISQNTGSYDLTVSGIDVLNKTYDGTTTGTVTGTPVLYGTVYPGDVVSLVSPGVMVGTFPSANAGNYDITIGGFSITGADAANYNFDDPIVAATINTAPLTASGVSVLNKFYDATTSATVNATVNPLSGIIGADDVTLNSGAASAIFPSINVANYNSISVSGLTLSGTKSANYHLVATTVSASITGAHVTVLGTIAQDKVYTGTTNAAIDVSGAYISAGIINSEPLGLTSATGTFASADVNGVGTPWAVTIATYVLSSSNYVVISFPGMTANITKAPLTSTGITASNKSYDGTTSSTINTGSAVISGAVNSETVTISSMSGTFANANVGTNKSITVSAYTLSSTNYTLTPNAITANITTAPLTITNVTANDKTYDSTTTATINIASQTVTGAVNAETITISSASGVFNNKNIGTTKQVTASYNLSSSNYYVASSPSLTANVTAANLSVSGITASNKTYNTSTIATLGGSATITPLGSDSVSLSGTAVGNFADKNIGNGKAVTITGLSLTGADSGNYNLVPQAGITANITAASITVSGITASNKTYDTNTTATLGGSAAITPLGSDTVSLTGTASGNFADKNVGTGKAVTITGLSLTGADSGNYTIIQQTGLTATITASSLPVTGITASNKTFDGTTTATLGGTAAITPIGADVVSLTGTAIGNFATSSQGVSKVVTITGLSLTGADSGNYSIVQQTGITADISSLGLTLTGITSSNKIYDGTTSATIDIDGQNITGTINGDIVLVTAATGNFASANVGTNIAVNVSYTLNSSNYVLSSTPSLQANITVAPLSITGFAASNKSYDGTASATITGSGSVLSGEVNGDTVTITSTAGTFADVNVNNNIAVTPTYILSSSNYYVATAPSLSANITTATLTVTGITVTSKVYDGNTSATINLGGQNISGEMNSETITITGATGNFASSDAANGISVTASYTINSQNYVLTNPVITGNITAAPLTIVGTLVTKTYNATNSVSNSNISIGTLSGIINNEDVTVSAPVIPAFTITSSDAGTYSITGSGFTLGGSANLSNYSLTQPTISATITQASLSAPGATILNKYYDATTSAIVHVAASPLYGILNGDDVSLDSSAASASFSSSNAGTYSSLPITGLTLTGTKSANYTLTAPTAKAIISPAIITISGLGVKNKYYDGTLNADITNNNVTLNNIQNSENVTLNTSSAVVSFPNQNASGTPYSLTFSGLALSGTANLSNYTLYQPTVSAVISPVNVTNTLTVGGLAITNKNYDGTTNAVVTGTPVLSGVLDLGTNVTLVSPGSLSASFTSSSAGTYDITVSGFSLTGADSGNYTFNQPVLKAVIDQAYIVASGVSVVNKSYNASTSATVNVIASPISGVLAGDAANVSLDSSTASASFPQTYVSTFYNIPVANLSLTGSKSANYNLITPSVTSNITGASISITGIFANNKVFDNNYVASLDISGSSVTGTYGGDVVTLVSATGQFASRNVGVGISATIASYTLSSSNYEVISFPALAANITKAPVTITGSVANNKTYDGTYVASINLSGASVTSGVVSGDTVTISTATGTFANKNVGTNIGVTAIYVLSSNNYLVTSSPSLAANITQAALSVSNISANNKVYDGTNSAVINTSSVAITGTVGGETVNVTGTATFADANAGTSKVVNAVYTPSSSNYAVTTSPNLTANITQALLSVTGITANNKVYDSNVYTSVNVASHVIIGAVNSETITLISGVGSFADENVGTSISVSLSSYILSSSNYIITSSPVMSADITQTTLTINGLTANNKTYDGTTNATLSGTASVLPLGGDSVTLVGTAIGTFADPNIASSINVSITGLSITGVKARNYNLSSLTLTANITLVTTNGGGGNYSFPVQDPTPPPTSIPTINIPPAINIVANQQAILIESAKQAVIKNTNVFTAISQPVVLRPIYKNNIINLSLRYDSNVLSLLEKSDLSTLKFINLYKKDNVNSLNDLSRNGDNIYNQNNINNGIQIYNFEQKKKQIAA